MRVCCPRLYVYFSIFFYHFFKNLILHINTLSILKLICNGSVVLFSVEYTINSPTVTQFVDLDQTPIKKLPKKFSTNPKPASPGKNEF